MVEQELKPESFRPPGLFFDTCLILFQKADCWIHTQIQPLKCIAVLGKELDLCMLWFL